MTSRYRLELPAPAKGFLDSFLIGNGRLGAALRGGVGTERLDLNLDTLWSGGPQTPDLRPPAASLLPELRAAIRDRDFERADAISRQMQGPGWTASYQPIGGLLFGFGRQQSGIPDGYRRHLDVANAVAEHRYGHGIDEVTVTSFASAPDGVIVARALGSGLLRADEMTLAFDCPHPAATRSWREGDIRWSSVAGRAPATAIPHYVNVETPFVYGQDEPDAQGTVAAGTGFAAVAAVQILPSGETLLVVVAADGFRGYQNRPSADLERLLAAATARVRAALAKGGDALQASHQADFKSYFDRVDLDLSLSPPDAAADPARAELLYHYGRYLLISSSRPGGEPANLQGIWNPDMRPAWSSNYTININTQMNYWPAEPSGLGELTEPLLRFIGDLGQTGRDTAERYYGAAGAAVHHNTDIWRFTTPVKGDPVWANWSSGLSWLVAHLWDHLDYESGEEDFARTGVLPTLRSVVAFALDMLVPYVDGRLVASPSSAPENLFLTPEGKRVAISEGTAMDQELAREIFTRFLRIASPASADDARLIVRTRAALAALRELQIGGSGDLLEWSDERPQAEPGHRHMSHLYGLYPGTRITETATPDLYAAAREALQGRLRHGGGHTGWSQAWVLCLAARLRDSSLAEDAIMGLLTRHTTPSLMVTHPYPGMPEDAVFQIDGNLGAVAGLGELLVQSHEGTISLLKALPPSWTNGTMRGQRCRGGHSVDVAWSDGQLREATVRAGATGTLVLDVPDEITAILVEEWDGTPVEADAVKGAPPGRTHFAWPAQIGASYDIRPAS
jgi:alpha-L-fucosidase 2